MENNYKTASDGCRVAEINTAEDKDGRYYISPTKMINQELEDEENYNLEGEHKDEPGTETVSANIVDIAPKEEKEKWIAAIQAELDSLNQLNVYEEMTELELRSKYGKQNVHIKKVPSKLVTTKKPLYDGQGGWKAKARICCCGNFEDGSIAHDVQNRAEVPATYEMKSLLTMAESQDWKVGALDIKTAFVHAELDDEEDGVYAVLPPAVAVRHGLIDPGTI